MNSNKINSAIGIIDKERVRDFLFSLREQDVLVDELFYNRKIEFDKDKKSVLAFDGVSYGSISWPDDYVRLDYDPDRDGFVIGQIQNIVPYYTRDIQYSHNLILAAVTDGYKVVVGHSVPLSGYYCTVSVYINDHTKFLTLEGSDYPKLLVEALLRVRLGEEFHD